ncbi:type II toxin-antitoxin system PemK/MazF family toxin [Actinoallomurus soli]|uniref:type II toxin-antitoxin system PemK/MazF family toxin n=1 Tax=Actinoallomurus soli TaxID=2952535 RepID=UPI0038737664
MTDCQISTTPTTPHGEHPATTTTERGWRTHVEVGTHTGLRQTSWGLVEQLRSASPVRLRRRIGEVDPMTMERICVIVRRLLEM